MNLGDASRMTVRIDRNTYTNPNELGGLSGNGLEYVAMGDGSRSRVVVRDSSFVGPLPGRTVVAGGRLDADPTLTEPPQSC